ncbi:MAG: radical SAM protein [Nitrospinae bacterium]|nr:radical SAM protein [Nitrospinota bacterium]
MKIVLANSVGIGKDGERYVHFPSRWTAVEAPSWYDRSKGWMTFYPFMLAYCSALLKRDTPHAVKFLDGALNNWDHAAYLEKIAAEKPDWLIMESSTLSFAMDIQLARAAKERTACKIVFAGQHASAFPAETLSAGADFVCTGEYEMTVKELLGGLPPEKILGLFPNPPRPLTDPDKLPWPEDNDVRRIDYIEPVVNEYREVEMFASRGCPLACNFCVAANVYYGGAGSWRPRDVEDVASEIAHLKAKYPEMEGVFFDDEAHNGRKEFVIALCRAIIAKGLDTLKYNAMCGYWNLDAETLGWMKKAGYYKLRVGIETADKEVAKTMQKSQSLKKLYAALEAAREAGIRVYGTFTYGALGSTAQKDRSTTALIKDLLQKGLLFDLQISICTPQPGTPFFRDAAACGYITTTDWSRYDGGRNVIQSYPHYPAEEIRRVVAEARRTASAFGGGARFRDCDFSRVESIAKGGGKLLLICSGPQWQTKRILEELARAGRTDIHLVMRPDPLSAIDGYKAFPFGEGSLSPESLEATVLASLKEQQYETAIVQVNHNGADRSDYADVFRLADIVAGHWIGVDTAGAVFSPSLARP